jgi:hypothetical protein
MKIIPENEVDEAAFNFTESLNFSHKSMETRSMANRLDKSFKAGVTFVESKVYEYIKDIIIENQGLKLYKDNEPKRFKAFAIEFAKSKFKEQVEEINNKHINSLTVIKSALINMLKLDKYKDNSTIRFLINECDTNHFKLFSRKEVEELFQKQRELCAENAKLVYKPDRSFVIDKDSILNAKLKIAAYGNETTE